MKNQFGQTVGNLVEDWQPRQMPILRKIEGHFCTLLPLNVQEHAELLFEAFQRDHHGEIYTYLPFGPFETFDSFQQWLQSAALAKLYFIIQDRKSNSFQGIASFHDIDVDHGVIEVGSILYTTSLQKTAAGTEVMYLMMKEAFETLGYRRYQWRCNSLNLASRKAAERLGFVFEGIFRQHYIFKGRNRDTAWYSILDTEWPQIKTKLEQWLSPTNFDQDGKQITRLSEIQNSYGSSS